MDNVPLCTAFERKLVHHCTPTFAALKPANLFSCPFEQPLAEKPRGEDGGRSGACQESLTDALSAARQKLDPHGVRIEILARRATSSLIYVYRPNLLKQSINQERVAAYLTQEGYDVSSLSSCITRLYQRIGGTDLKSQITGNCSFPHEIGFFLGYPYEDVIGFIENRGENFLCSGCWKVYAKERDAQTCFCCYKNCTVMYESLFDEGVGIECLAAVDENFPAAEAFLAAG